jgi:putative oxygen-independent coproporphyrinogen III oxidase
LAGIYLHIPFCRQACHYCNFHFSVSQRNRPEFVKAIVKEVRMQKDFFGAGTGMDTLYFGGGTPSLLSEEELREIVNSLHRSFPVEQDAEITLEANPDDLDKDKLKALREMGVNRLSIGIQSFAEADLRYMNRSHSSGQALKVLTDALETGFSNITADLIYGTPGMDDRQWVQNIMTLVNMGIPHISAYSLTVESKTALDVFIRKGKAAPVDEEQSARQFEILRDITSSHGYDHYEISNFGKPGYYSRHNLSYWSGEPYLGLGPSAHSFYPGHRQWNIANTQVYIEKIEQGIIPFQQEQLSADQQYNEYIMTALRTMWGAEKKIINERYGYSFLEQLKRSAEKYLENGLLEETPTHYRITAKGKFLSDGIAADLFAGL